MSYLTEKLRFRKVKVSYAHQNGSNEKENIKCLRRCGVTRNLKVTSYTLETGITD
jgi:hypothetical protein